MKSAYLAKTAKPGRAQKTRAATIPAPTKGWDISQNLAATSPLTARILDNWFPTTTGIKMRGGTRTHATISTDDDPVESMMSYNSPTQRKLFAATETDIFDVQSVADPDVPPAADVSGQTGGYYSYVNFTTSGGSFMTAVNGRDPLLLYDAIGGWQQITGVSAPISITGIASTSLLSFVWVYRNRQFFIEASSLRARCLPVGAVGGALTTIDLNGVFQNGGRLVFGATWSVDAGDGLDDKCVFFTSEGELAVYEGGDPGDPNDWRLIGLYSLTSPVGPRATMRAGGDLIIGTYDGMIPVSKAISTDISQLNLAALSRPISPAWQKEVVARRSLPWEIVRWPERSMAIVSLPVTTAGQEPIAFVINTVTNKWCRYTNWDARCLVLHGDQVFFGTSDGKVKLAEVGGNDDGNAIYYSYVGNPEHLGSRGSLKSLYQARTTYMGSTPFIDRVSVSVDYVVELPSPPNAAPDIESDEWDAGEWDQANWDAASASPLVLTKWVSIGRSGVVFLPQVQITGALTPTPDTEFVSMDLLYELGGVAV